MSTGKDDTGQAPPAPEPTFGRFLQAARLERNIRLDHVAEETRVSLGTLEAIEAEDVPRLPPDVFLRGFLRAFARAVGADEHEAVARYVEWRRIQEAGPAAAYPQAIARRGGGWKLVLLLTLLAGLIAVSVLAYQHWSQRRAAEPPAAASETSAPPAPAAAAAPAQTPSEAAKRPQMPAVPMHVLVITAQDEGWVKVSIDQGTPSEYHLKAGGQLRLEAANGFNLLVGNAAGLKMTLDDRPIQVPGKRGEVVNLQLP